MRCKMRHATATDMWCKMPSAGSTMGGKMRRAATDVGRKMRPAATEMSRKMWPAAAHGRGKMRAAAARVRGKMRSAAARMRNTARMSTAAGMSAGWRRRAGGRCETQGQADAGDTQRNGSHHDHNVLSVRMHSRERTRARVASDKTVGCRNGSGTLAAGLPVNVSTARICVMLRCTGPMRAARSIAATRLAMDTV